MTAPVLRRLRSLAVGELVNIPLQAWIWFGMFGFPLTAINGVGYLALALTLGAGAFYWVLKYRELRTRASAPPGIRVLSMARTPIAVCVIGVAIMAIIAAVINPGAGTIPGASFAVFAVVEYINYFHIQLSYGTKNDRRRLRRHGLRESSLARDIRRLRNHM